MTVRFSRPSGYTLVEILVVIAVSSLMAGLLLPAVQSVRASARRVECANHLRQLGLGVNDYVGVFGIYPPSSGSSRIRYELHQFSVYTQLLPYLDRTVEYHAINFEVPAWDFYLFDHARGSYQANRTVMSATLDVLLCPSDGGWGGLGWTGHANYRANLGTSLHDRPSPTEAGPFAVYEICRPASIHDGLSQTVAFSEKLRGGLGTTEYQSARDALFPQYLVPDAGETIRLCRFQKSSTPQSFGEGGLIWFVGTLTQTNYNHFLGPNSSAPDCIVGGGYPMGALAARSLHPGGVSCGYLDGSVRFTRDTVSLATWQALGTRAGNEILEDVP